ncbi:hypothetical protein K0M31_001115 [Melipona bicolor]|uniref:Uncharacterized protein n=1 Tax=Melipona bicolor TaxID=60889 RepID=A0AA40GFT8_9HYME|nr:hypothetical protein K0M31_001115 [Melipona bicolor]
MTFHSVCRHGKPLRQTANSNVERFMDTRETKGKQGDSYSQRFWIVGGIVARANDAERKEDKSFDVSEGSPLTVKYLRAAYRARPAIKRKIRIRICQTHETGKNSEFNVARSRVLRNFLKYREVSWIQRKIRQRPEKIPLKSSKRSVGKSSRENSQRSLRCFLVEASYNFGYENAVSRHWWRADVSTLFLILPNARARDSQTMEMDGESMDREGSKDQRVAICAINYRPSGQGV